MVRERVPVRKVRGSRFNGCLIFMSLLAGMVTAGAGRSQVKSVRGQAVRGYVRMYLKHSTLNSVIEQELRDRRVEGRANATSSA